MFLIVGIMILFSDRDMYIYICIHIYIYIDISADLQSPGKSYCTVRDQILSGLLGLRGER